MGTKSGKDCVLPYFHLLNIKRLDRQLVLRFSWAQVRINASTNELCDRLTLEALREWKSSGESLQNLAG
jgi:hypothetical protein